MFIHQTVRRNRSEFKIGLTQSAKHNIGGNKHDAIDQIFDGDVFESKNRYWQLSLAYVF